MSKHQLRNIKFLPAQFFILIGTVCILAGWLMGALGWFDFQTHTDYAAEAVMHGAFWGLVFGSFLSFCSMGLVTAWIWRKRYPNLSRAHAVYLILGWIVIPIFILFYVFCVLRL